MDEAGYRRLAVALRLVATGRTERFPNVEPWDWIEGRAADAIEALLIDRQQPAPKAASAPFKVPPHSVNETFGGHIERTLDALETWINARFPTPKGSNS